MLIFFALVFCALFFACALVILGLLPIARHIGLLDRPGGRKQHYGSIPLIGGIAIFLSIAGAAFFGLEIELPLLCSLGALLLLGICDDLYDMPWKVKLLGQTTICIFLVSTSGVYIESLGTLPNNVELLLGDTGYALTIIAMVGLINSTNMIDGLDGLAGGLSMMALIHLVLAMYLIDRPMGTTDLMLIIAVCGALTAFLVFNLMPVHKKIFLGDAGAMMLGLLLAYLLIKVSQMQPLTSTLPTSLVAWIVALPVFETLTLMATRIRFGRSAFSADRNHLHHLLIDNGLSPRNTLLVILATADILFWSGFAIAQRGGLIAGLIFSIMPLGYYASIIYPLKRRLRNTGRPQ